MTEEIQSIREDYDHDAMPVVYESNPEEEHDSAFGDDIDTLASDLKETNDLEEEINQLLNCTAALESYGMNPTAFAVMKTTQLLSGTSLDALATEHFGTTPSEDPESQMAIEALVDKIKDKIYAWSAKIVSFTSTMCSKALSMFSSVWDRIKDTATTLTQKAWDTTKVAGKTIKAHPYKTIAVVVGAAAAVAGIMAFVASGMPGDYANESALKSWIIKIHDKINAIHWYDGSLHSKIVDGNRIFFTLEENATTGLMMEKVVTDLGWSQTAVKAISGQTSKIWASLKTGFSAVSQKAVSVAAKFNKIADPGTAAKTFVAEKTGSQIGGWATQQITNKVVGAAFWGVIGVLYLLLKNVALKAFRMVSETFNSLRGVTTQPQTT